MERSQIEATRDEEREGKSNGWEEGGGKEREEREGEREGRSCAPPSPSSDD